MATETRRICIGLLVAVVGEFVEIERIPASLVAERRLLFSAGARRAVRNVRSAARRMLWDGDGDGGGEVGIE